MLSVQSSFVACTRTLDDLAKPPPLDIVALDSLETVCVSLAAVKSGRASGFVRDVTFAFSRHQREETDEKRQKV